MIINANSLHIPLASGVAQCVVTSPPYYGLRDYGVPGQLGLEPTPEEYIANMVQVFREVWRVMRDDGVLFLNIGDSYFGSTQTGGTNSKEGSTKRAGRMFEKPVNSSTNGIKPKDLIGIPWMLAFALRADGWYLRSDIIWHKPNPMPESVTDRPTKSHEYVFLLTKSPRYYFDQEAVREEQDPSSLERLKRGWNGNGDRGYPNGPQNHMKNYMGKTEEEVNALPGRNIRTVWTIATQPTKEAHFATYPEKLVEPCILAGTSARGCCPKCGAPWERNITRVANYEKRQDRGQPEYKGAQVDSSGWKPAIVTDNGWQPTCACDAGDPVPCLVLDPFSGSGTTGRVAIKNGRRYVGLELNWKYIDEISRKRIQVQMGTGL